MAADDRSRGTPSGRVLAVREGEAAGPTVVVLGGVHGNEPAGTHAFRRVVSELDAERIPLRGRVVGLAGNLAALARHHRYIDADLNRGWSDLHVSVCEQRPETSEDLERAEIVRAIREYAAGVERVTFLDLHSTSGDGPAFACMSDVVRNRRIAFALGVPVVLGLEEVLYGTLVGWLTERGHVAVAIEGGRHDDPVTVERHASAIWLALATAGCVDPAAVPGGCDAHERSLREAAAGLPSVLEIRHRHGLADDDSPSFVMEPGFANFTPLERGQLVARDADAEVRAPCRGMMMLPRYQRQGDDGYFVVAPVSRFWLALSAFIRRTPLDHLVPLLPGVRRTSENRCSVDRHVARWLVIELFHLVGYRRMKSDDSSRFLFGRRRPDRHPPLPF